MIKKNLREVLEREHLLDYVQEILESKKMTDISIPLSNYDKFFEYDLLLSYKEAEGDISEAEIYNNNSDNLMSIESGLINGMACEEYLINNNKFNTLNKIINVLLDAKTVAVLAD